MEEVKDVRELLSLSNTKFNDLVTRSQEIQSKCSDFIVTKANDKNIRYQPDTLNFIYKPDTDEVRTVGATRHALSQLCNKIGVPVRYLEKCIDSGRLDLASDNINSWLEDFDKNLFIREYNGSMRGVLSDRYSVLDTPDILDVLGNFIDDNKYEIKGYYLTPERFHVRLIQRDSNILNGEDIFPGLQIDSSDVGRSVLTTQFFIYKQVCTNGLVVPKAGGMLFQQKHIGITREDFLQGFSESINRVPSIVENTVELISSAKRDEIKYRRALKDSEERENLMNYVKAHTRLSDEGVEKVLDTMQSDFSISKWGMINAITKVAQDYTLERRLELESIAGSLLVA